MQPTYIPVGQLFGSQTHHTVPLFQRPYVWDREEQWEPLWEDLQGLIHRVERRQTDAAVAGHFLGTVVLEQVSTPSGGSLLRREVIDGQQRLTTLQIMLKAAEHALSVVADIAKEADRTAIDVARRQIAFLTENPAYSLPDERYKVWPTNEDRASFRTVMDCAVGTAPAAGASRMADAYAFFRQAFLNHLAGPDLAYRAQSFSSALRDHLRLIVLDLDDSDEPQAIFETLNAHGTPLLPADLMKNWLLWEASRQKIPGLPLYESYWLPFDREHLYWRERIGVGHAARARVDTFLQNWLTRLTLEPVSPKHLYDRFLRYTSRLAADASDHMVDVSNLMGMIRSDAQNYEKIDKPSGSDRFSTFLGRLKTLDIVVLHPVLLELMDRPGTDSVDLDRAAVALESYLVRRMICGYQTRGYGSLAITLLKMLQSLPADQPAGNALIAELTTGAAVAGSEAWPDDAMFRHEWKRRRFYGGLRRDRVLMILQAIEEHYQRDRTKSEPVLAFDFSQLQVEHIMPQNWQQHWGAAPDGDSAARDYVVHGIGNLTLVSGRLNPSLSNAPWLPTDASANAKRNALEEHSKLELNRLLLINQASWNEATIETRAETLFDAAREIWKAPTAMMD